MRRGGAVPVGAPRGNGQPRGGEARRHARAHRRHARLASRTARRAPSPGGRDGGPRREPAADPGGRRNSHGRTTDRVRRPSGRAGFRHGQPERAAASLGRAIAYFERTSPEAVPSLRLLLARSHAALGHDDAAEAELEGGIREMESMRSAQADVGPQTVLREECVAVRRHGGAPAGQATRPSARALVRGARTRPAAVGRATAPDFGKKVCRSLAHAGARAARSAARAPGRPRARLLRIASGSRRILGRQPGRPPGSSRFRSFPTSSGASPPPTKRRWRPEPRSRPCASRRQGCSTRCCAR